MKYFPAQLMAAVPKLYMVQANDTESALMLCLTCCSSEELCPAELGLQKFLSRLPATYGNPFKGSRDCH